MQQRHFHEQLSELKDMLIDMASLVEKAIAKSVRSLQDRDAGLAAQVVDEDDRINRLEIRIDEQCLKLLALQQPMAVDLRFITSAMKINNDLERMGDHAVNIAQQAEPLFRKESMQIDRELFAMAEIVQSMVKDSISSFVEADIPLARKICMQDDDVDRFDDNISRQLLTSMAKHSESVAQALHFILISKNLERIADLSTNIGEEVIFIYRAKTIKHHMDEIEDIRPRS